MFERAIALVGMPRSGTSWLGSIFDSSPDVAYRFQPLFSYAHKNGVGLESTAAELREYLAQVYRSRDPFVNQTAQREIGIHPRFEKHPTPSHLAFKNVRHHQLLRHLTETLPELTTIAIVRHPCGCINSWIKSPREFPSEANLNSEWRFGTVKKDGRPEEFWGFDDWCEVTKLHVHLGSRYPDRFYVVRYEDLVRSPREETQRLFDRCGLRMCDQTREFLKASHDRHVEDPYAVYKSPRVADDWRSELSPAIRNKILEEVANDPLLQRFL